MEISQGLREGSYLRNNTYRIIRVLGQGGFGITYLAFDESLDRYVAIKEFFPQDYCDREGTTRHVTTLISSAKDLVEKLRLKFLKEAKNIAKFDHPGIIKIHAAFEENNTAYYVMEYIEGGTLEDYIRENGPFPYEKAINYINRIGHALDYVHSQHINHLDIKPANIMLRASDGQPIMIDFGVSKQYDHSGHQTSTSPVGLSDGYSPLEQYQSGGINEFSPQTDLYALAATLYFTLTGNHPMQAALLIDNELKFPEGIDQRVTDAIRKAMSTSRKNRQPSVGAFLQELNGLAPSAETENESVQAEEIYGQQDNFIPASEDNEDISENDQIESQNNLIATESSQAPHAPKTTLKPMSSSPSPGTVNEMPGAPQTVIKPAPQTVVKQPSRPVPDPQIKLSKKTESKAAQTEIKNNKKAGKGKENKERPTKVGAKLTMTEKPEAKTVVWGSIAAGVVIAIIVAFILIGKSGGAGSEDSEKNGVAQSENVNKSEVKDMPWVTLFGKSLYSGQTIKDETGTVVPNGKGSFKITEGQYKGASYEGEFVNGRIEGQGTYTMNSGDVFVGKMKGDMFDEGRYMSVSTGEYFEGKFKDGEPYDGNWCDKSGNVLEKVTPAESQN